MRLIAVVAALLFCPLVHAEVVRLEDLEARAVGERPALAAVEAQAKRARAAIEVAESRSRPTFGLALEGSTAPGGTLHEVATLGGDEDDAVLVEGTPRLSDEGAFDPNLRGGASLRFDATLADFGRTAAAVRAARAHRGAVRAEVESVRSRIVARVRAHYLSWIAAHELAAVADDAAAASRARRTRVEALIQEGARPESDRAPARTDEALARLEQARARDRLVVARLGLEEVSGTAIPATAAPDRAVLDRAPPAHPGHDADVESIERRREATRLEARAAERGARPVLSTRLEAGLGAQTGFGQGAGGVFPVYRAALSLAVPLWDGGRSAAEAASLRAASAELEARAREASEARRAAQTRARAQAEAAGERLAIARELVDATETRLRQAEERYDLGAGTIEGVAEARNAVLRARSEEVLARVDRATALFQLAP